MMPSEHPIKNIYRAKIRHALGPSEVVEFEDGLLVIDEHGRITACGPTTKLKEQLPKDCSIHDYRDSWIFPGFVDTHVHLPQLDCRNKNGLTLLDWLKTYIFPHEAKFSDPKIAQDTAQRFFDEIISYGVTLAAIYSTVHYEATDIAFQSAKEKGLRAIIGQALNDQNVPTNLQKPAKQLLRETEKLILKWHGKEKRLFCSVTPRFAPSCSKELIQGCGKMAQESGAYFQTHMAETRDEVSIARDLYGFKNYPSFYEKLFCLGKHSLFAHSIFLTEDEWKVLSLFDCCVAHCPTSNVFLKSGTMPIAQAEKYGIRYGFGSDVGAGPTFSMREISNCALEVHPKSAMDEKKAFYLATLGGAEALSMGHEVGNFAEGKWADFSIFEKSDFKGRAKAVFVAGQPILRTGNES